MLTKGQIFHYTVTAFMYTDMPKVLTPTMVHGGFMVTRLRQKELFFTSGVNIMRKHIQCIRHTTSKIHIVGKYLRDTMMLISTMHLLLVPDHFCIFPSMLRFKKFIEGLYELLKNEDNRCQMFSQGTTFPLCFDHATGTVIPYSDEDLVRLFNDRVETAYRRRKNDTAKEFEQLVETAKATAERDGDQCGGTDNGQDTQGDTV